MLYEVITRDGLLGGDEIAGIDDHFRTVPDLQALILGYSYNFV